MIAEDLGALFAEVNRGIAEIKTDLILIKYDLAQIESKLNNMNIAEPASVQEEDPFKDRRFTQL